MRKKLSTATLVLGLLLGALVPQLLAQVPSQPTVARRELAKLEFLVGNWHGEGWMEFGPGKRKGFTGQEEVRFKIDGVLLLVEGTHHTRFPGQDKDTKIHHAIATVSYDESTGNYRVQAHKADGKSVDAHGTFQDGAFVWGFKDPRLGQLRFTIRLNEHGQWHETAERSPDGQAWSRYLEMTLTKTP